MSSALSIGVVGKLSQFHVCDKNVSGWSLVLGGSHVKLSKSLNQLFLKQTELKLSHVHPRFPSFPPLGSDHWGVLCLWVIIWHRLQLLDELMYIFSLPLVKTFIFVIKNGLKDFWHDAIYLQKFRLNHSPLSPQWFFTSIYLFSDLSEHFSRV